MKFLALIAFAGIATALPSVGPQAGHPAADPSDADVAVFQQVQRQCSTQSVFKCCNESDEPSDHGLIGDMLSPKACTNLDLDIFGKMMGPPMGPPGSPVPGANDQITSQCDTDIYCCNTGDQNGFINIGCSQILGSHHHKG